MLLKLFYTLIGILLIPIAIGTGKAFFIVVSSLDSLSGSLRLFERGILVYLCAHVLVFRPVYFYVLGHEFVHVLATWISGGKVVSFDVSPKGGNVTTSKTNFFIELSPYFVPIQTILVGLLFMGVKLAGKDSGLLTSVFIFLIGMTLAFHVVMTIEVLKMEQPDIAKSGLLFSSLLIFICNLIIVAGVFSLIFREISFTDFMKSLAVIARNIYSASYYWISTFIEGHRFW